ncbi:hypothetical protein [Acetivibrio cellulolyticus]|nr:hypothetical protein [Acetivibrio cellulolyticus]
MEKVLQSKKVIKLTEAEKKVLSAYSAYTNENDLKPLQPNITDKKIVN